VTVSAAETWAAEPLRRFVGDARVTLALLLHRSGQVVAQHGFTRSVDVMAACSLAAGILASAGELGRMLDGRPFTVLHHGGEARQLFLAEVIAPVAPYLFLTVFDGESSFGLVRLYFDELAAAVAATAPEPAVVAQAALEENFEWELNRNLAVLFGRA
jgi:hypothetical protein